MKLTNKQTEGIRTAEWVLRPYRSWQVRLSLHGTVRKSLETKGIINALGSLTKKGMEVKAFMLKETLFAEEAITRFHLTPSIVAALRVCKVEPAGIWLAWQTRDEFDELLGNRGLLYTKYQIGSLFNSYLNPFTRQLNPIGEFVYQILHKND